VHEQVVHRLWSDHAALIPQPAAVISADTTLREFAQSLTPDAVIADLRDPRPGSGFAWGMFGPRTMVQRFGTERLWALTRPPKQPGFFSRLFGG
jgi:hypothetical protein